MLPHDIYEKAQVDYWNETGKNAYPYSSVIKKAMEEYAEQEAKAFRVWCNNQVIAGRTDAKLWEDYQAEKQSNVI